MKRLVTIIITCSFLLVILSSMGCASVPREVDVLVRYPMEGKIVWMSDDGSIKRNPYFVIDHEDLIEFLEHERELLLKANGQENNGVYYKVR